MSKFNICLVKPDNYIHSFAFMELGELIYHSLRELGLEATIYFNKIEPNCQNILIGCHLLDPSWIPQLPASTIILNTEQISSAADWNKTVLAWAEKFEIWDYSTKNIQTFKEYGLSKVKHFKIGFQQELVRLDSSKNKDVDILFYGAINERRKSILAQLEAKGLRVKVLFGVYARERDEWIERSKIVLNHHFYDSQIFEIVRVFYLLTNSIAVVGEVNDTTFIDPMCSAGIYPGKYEELIDQCQNLVQNDVLRQKIQLAAIESISQYPQKIYTQEVLGR